MFLKTDSKCHIYRREQNFTHYALQYKITIQKIYKKCPPTKKYVTSSLPRPELCPSSKSLQCFTNRVCKVLFPSVYWILDRIPNCKPIKDNLGNNLESSQLKVIFKYKLHTVCSSIGRVVSLLKGFIHKPCEQGRGRGLTKNPHYLHI